MKHFVRNITSTILFLVLPGCSLLIPDCSKVSYDPEAYRKCIASQGNSQAQYELGLLAYGREDYKAALKWLRMAAAPSSGRTPIYMPPVGGQKYGTVMMMDTGKATAGHGKAQSLLAEIYDKGLGVEMDKKQADHYREMAGNNVYRER